MYSFRQQWKMLTKGRIIKQVLTDDTLYQFIVWHFPTLKHFSLRLL
jgi:hypothetical protein